MLQLGPSTAHQASQAAPEGRRVRIARMPGHARAQLHLRRMSLSQWSQVFCEGQVIPQLRNNAETDNAESDKQTKCIGCARRFNSFLSAPGCALCLTQTST